MSLFSKVKIRKPKLNKFDLSQERKLSCNMGKLIPIMVQDILPGDVFRVSSEVMLRMAPMLAPIMHRVDVTVHYFFVPNRIVWEEWEDFITGGREGDLTPVPPQMQFNTTNCAAGNFAIGSLSDYMGLPTFDTAQVVSAAASVVGINLLPFRAYQLIYDEFYRDQNVSASIDILKTSGIISGAELAKLMVLRDRAWEKDYFTSCLPWAQRGDEVLIPMEGSVTYMDQSVVAATDDGGIVPGTLGSSVVGGLEGNFSTTPEAVRIENIDSVVNAVVTINDLRRSVAIQKWLEANARGGARYIEQILTHFGVVSSDARLQRPEYLGGGRQPIVISEVVSTAQFEGVTEDLPQGNMAGHGVSVGRSNAFRRRFEEHGFVIGLMSVLPRTAYQQGLPRMFSRPTKYDYYWPELAHLGEQAVLNREIFLDPTNTLPVGGTFGYQSRYSEYKYNCSHVHGEFRDTLAFWHMGRIFATPPGLNADFIESDPTHRIFAVTDPDVHKLYVQVFNKIDGLRPMPYFGTPSFGGV